MTHFTTPGSSLLRAVKAGEQLFRVAEAGRQTAGQGAMGEMIQQLEESRRRWENAEESLRKGGSPAQPPSVHVHHTITINIETDE